MNYLNQNTYRAYCIRDGWSVHQKHRRDVSGQLYWEEQSRLMFKHYYLKNGQLRLKTL